MTENEPRKLSPENRIGILLFHGLTGMPTELKPLANHLESQGFQVETPLIRGHGETHQDLLKTTWQDWLEGAQESLVRMRLTCNAIYVGGLSMGATLATSLAILNPDIKGLLLISPHMGVLQDNLQSTQCLLSISTVLKPLHDRVYWAEKPPYGLHDQRLQNKIAQTVADSHEGQTQNYGLYRTYIGSIYQMLNLIEFCKKHGHQVQCPALILQSLEDTITKIENATILYERLGSGHKQIRMMSGCNHVMTVDLRKEDVAFWIENFVRKHAFLPLAMKSYSEEIEDNEQNMHQLHVDLVSGFYPADSRLDGFSDYAKSLMNMMQYLERQDLKDIRLHRLIVRNDEQPVMYLPVFETTVDAQAAYRMSMKRFDSMEGLNTLWWKLWMWLMKLTEPSKVLITGLPIDHWETVRMDTDIQQEAWYRSGLALKALQLATGAELFVFPNDDSQQFQIPEKEKQRLLEKQMPASLV